MGARGGMQSAMRQFCRNKWGKSKAAENLLASAADCFFLSSVRKYWTTPPWRSSRDSERPVSRTESRDSTRSDALTAHQHNVATSGTRKTAAINHQDTGLIQARVLSIEIHGGSTIDWKLERVVGAVRCRYDGTGSNGTGTGTCSRPRHRSISTIAAPYPPIKT